MKKSTPLAPVSVSRIEIDFVNQTMTLWDFDEPVATYRPERTGFDIHIVTYDPFKDDLLFPQRDLAEHDSLTKE